MANNRRLLSLLSAGAAALALSVAAAPHASADPDPAHPGQVPAGWTAATTYAGVGADAFAELTNNLAASYNATNPTVKLASYDAVNPATGAAQETIATKPGCSIGRPNGANGGITAILTAQQHVTDAASPYCIDFVRSSRARGTAAGEANLTFYAQSRDAVSYATIGNAYAPTGGLTKTQLKNIFTCNITNWAAVGGQPGAIHLYLPPATAATYTFFLTAIGVTGGVNDVQAGCGTSATNPTVVFNAQQNDGRTLLGDPQGIAPYAVTKWAAQTNDAPQIGDFRGGAVIGLVNNTTLPFSTGTVAGDPKTYLVLNPSFADSAGANASFGRYFFNVVRKTVDPANPTQQETDLKNIFGPGGYVCSNESVLLVPFGNGLLDADPNESCGQAN